MLEGLVWPRAPNAQVGWLYVYVARLNLQKKPEFGQWQEESRHKDTLGLGMAPFPSNTVPRHLYNTRRIILISRSAGPLFHVKVHGLDSTEVWNLNDDQTLLSKQFLEKLKDAWGIVVLAGVVAVGWGMKGTAGKL